MEKNILITGANGQVGQELHHLITKESRLNQSTFFYTDKETLDITDSNALENFCKENCIDTIINCAAYTAVDKAEEEQESTDIINHLATKHLATIAKESNISLVHISTDYVFDGTNHTPYIESDKVNPQSVYGTTKLAGEEIMVEINPANSIILRTSWVYSSFGNNFVKTMLRLGKERDSLGVIFDQVGTPTYARDLAHTILHIVESDTINPTNTVQVFHYSNEGVTSWYDFAKAIFEISNITCNVNPILTEAYPTPAKRPHYSLLNKAKIKETYSLSIPYWRDSLETCLITLTQEESK
jgi:dTDP-4-dehydrorhamnose reductase